MEKYIGCSGYYYNHWKEIFYPGNLPKKQWLIYYSGHFNTVEINNTFYRMPDEKTIKNWYAITPEKFIFAVKGYRYFTHLRKFNIDREFRENLNVFQKTVSALEEKTGPLLWQLPRNFTGNIEKLSAFCKLLSTGFRHVFEFRNESWFVKEVFEVLSVYGHGLCIVSAPSSIPAIVASSREFAYIRFHGEGAWYRDNYSEEAIRRWKENLEQIKVNTIYAYFNNDVNGYAINNAKSLISMFSESI